VTLSPGATVDTVIGTTPDGATVTQTSTVVANPSIGPDGVAIDSGAPLAQTNTTVAGQTIDGIQCSRLSQLAYQTYAHLQLDVDGRDRALPGAIGLVNAKATVSGTTTTYDQTLCSYWVRTRSANGVIEVDSPLPRTYTLGQLFDIWGESLSPLGVADAHGRVTAVVNGRRWHGNPRAIPLREHESIQLAVGQPVPRFKPVDWSVTDL
jgi:hypothetical protein